MSALGGKADIIQGVAKCLLIARSGHRITQPPHNSQYRIRAYINRDRRVKLVTV